MRRPAILIALLAAAAPFLPTACGAGDSVSPDTARRSALWQSLPAGVLSPREGALGLWTGSEILLVGGSDAPPCPPNAECVAPDVPPLADGAAFDPQTGAWRRIADSPVPFDWAQGIVVGTTAYVWIPGSTGRPQAASAFLAYRIEDDRWEELPPPSEDPDAFSGIVQASDRIVAYTGSDEWGEQPDFVFDPATRTWSELPPDPLSPSFDRSMIWSGEELVLFDRELVPNPGAEEPAVARAAALDLKTGSWRRLPDSEIISSGPWVRDGERLVNPTLGGADGGEVGNWGRVYPYGGIFEPASGRWSPLPDGPEGEEDFGSGVLTDSGGHYFAYQGWILDATTDTWIEVPSLDTGELVTGRTVVSAGDDLVVFGGARWKEHSSEATLLADAWIWSPRASSSAEASDQPPVAGSSGTVAEGLVSVPDVVGLSESEAVKALGASGLIANVRYARDAPRTANVLHSDPEAGTTLPADSVVALSISLAPHLPRPGQEHEGEMILLGRMVRTHPGAFVGTYRDESAVLHVVFGPRGDPETWEARLKAAAKGITYPAPGLGYRTDTCPRDRASLRAIQYEIAPPGRSTKWWTENQQLAFGVWVHPSTCTVRVESDLLAPADIQALVGRYGTAISFDTSEGSAGSLLPLID